MQRLFVVHLLSPDGESGLAVRLKAVERNRLARFAADGSSVLAGVAIATKERAESLGEQQSYLVVGSRVASDVNAIAAADALMKKLQAKFTAAGVTGGIEALSSFLQQAPASIDGRNKLTLMLYQWVRDSSPPFYLSGEDMVHEAFVAHLYCVAMGKAPLQFSVVAELIAEAHPAFAPIATPRLVSNRVNSIFETTFSHRMNRVADIDLKVADLPGLRSGQDMAMVWFLIVAGILSGATEVALVALLVDLAVNFLQFLHEMHMAERDGEINETEVSSVFWALIFMGIPILPFFLDQVPKSKVAGLVKDGVIGKAGSVVKGGFTGLQLVSLVALFAMFIRGTVEQLRRALEYEERLSVARKTGFGSYVEVDLENSIVIPGSALRL